MDRHIFHTHSNPHGSEMSLDFKIKQLFSPCKTFDQRINGEHIIMHKPRFNMVINLTSYEMILDRKISLSSLSVIIAPKPPFYTANQIRDFYLEPVVMPNVESFCIVIKLLH